MDSLYNFLISKKSENLAFSSTIRENAIETYKKLPLPVKKQEDWKYSDLSNLFDIEYNEVANNFETNLFKIESKNKLVFINGCLKSELSNFNNKDIEIIPISENAVATNLSIEYINKSNNLDNKFSALNTAFANNGVIIKFKKNNALSEPLVIEYINNSKVATFENTKNIIIAEEGSVSEVIEIHSNKDLCMLTSNIVTNIFVNENASIDYTILQTEKECVKINSHYVHQYKNSKFTAHTFQLDGNLIRNNLIINHENTHCETSLNGIFFPIANQHFDNFTIVNHTNEHCTTNENYRGLANDSGVGIFTGKIFVAKGAQKTLAQQSNKNIVLSNKAKIHSKPQLEIYADDVSCSHGSTTGQIDKDALFYCQSRGISKQDALKLLINAFLVTNIRLIKHKEIATFVEEKINLKLA
ncbi:MAG: Fe-S cluster assembly protein SufD [Bacteroidales bacterium]|nr:Fe-S cluster assembly protein SufD [Bacteroidales bacterium]